MFAGAIMMTGAGCAETHSSERVAYAPKLPDNFSWSAYQAIPKPERAALAPLQKEWLDLVDRSLNDYRAAYAAKNGVARDAMIAEAVERQEAGYGSLIKRINTEGLDNWAFRVSDDGLVMGPAVIFDYWTTGSFLNREIHYAVSQSFLLTIKVDLRSIAPQSREAIASAEADGVVYVSLPPESFTVSSGITGYGPFILTHRINSSDALPALAAPRRSLFVDKPDRVRLASTREPQLYKQLLAGKAAEDAAAIAATKMKREQEATTLQQQIAGLKEELVQHIYANGISPSAVRRWLGRSLESDSYLDDKPEPQVLFDLQRLSVPAQELLNDTRLAFAASLAPTPDSQLKAFTDAKTIRHDFFDDNNFYATRAENLSRALRSFLRADANSSRILINADALLAARYQATASTPEGRCWMTRLAQLAVLWDRGEAIVVSSSQQNVRFAEGGLAEYLKHLPHQPTEIAGLYTTPAMKQAQQDRGSNFDQFDQHLAAARAGNMPQLFSFEERKAAMISERQRLSQEARQRRSGR